MYPVHDVDDVVSSLTVATTRILRRQTLTFPPHMAALPQSTIESIATSTDAVGRVLACGVDPRDDSLTIVTFEPAVRTIVPNGRLIPASAVPSEDGRHVNVTFQGHAHVCRLDSAAAISASSDALRGVTIHVGDTYMGELDVTPSPEGVDP